MRRLPEWPGFAGLDPRSAWGSVAALRPRLADDQERGLAAQSVEEMEALLGLLHREACAATKWTGYEQVPLCGVNTSPSYWGLESRDGWRLKWTSVAVTVSMAKECRVFFEKAVSASGISIPASMARALATGVAPDVKVVEPAGVEELGVEEVSVPEVSVPEVSVPAAPALAGAVPDLVAPVGVVPFPTLPRTLAFRAAWRDRKAAAKARKASLTLMASP